MHATLLTAVAFGLMLAGALIERFYQSRRQQLWRVEYSGSLCDDTDFARGYGSALGDINIAKAGSFEVRAKTLDLATVRARKRLRSMLTIYQRWNDEPKLHITQIQT